MNIELLLDLLDDHGFDNVHGLATRVTYLPTVSSSCPIGLLDIRMPHIDGYAVMEQLQNILQTRRPLSLY